MYQTAVLGGVGFFERVDHDVLARCRGIVGGRPVEDERRHAGNLDLMKARPPPALTMSCKNGASGAACMMRPVVTLVMLPDWKSMSSCWPSSMASSTVLSTCSSGTPMKIASRNGPRESEPHSRPTPSAFMARKGWL